VKKETKKSKKKKKETKKSSKEIKEESLEEKIKEVEAIEETVEERSLEVAEGITDSLEQVDMRDLLQHSGEEQQKTRAHLEEELAMASWKPESSEDEEVNYGTIKNNSGGEKSYVENPEQKKDAVSENYKTINPYASSGEQGDLYDAEKQRVEAGEIGEIRREDRSQIEIQGLTKKADMRPGDATGNQGQNENYEQYT
jgi:hypothetical protein